jgi:hypothetical protein
VRLKLIGRANRNWITIRALIARDMADASLLGLSADRQFATAYNAALQAGKIAIACSGYRVTARAGHHAITFEAAHLSLGPNAATLTDYFDACRRKRNVIDYDNSSVATETEAAELVRKAGEFHAARREVGCSKPCSANAVVCRFAITPFSHH